LDASEDKPSRTEQTFGLWGIGAAIAFSISGVFVLNAWLFVHGSAALWNALGAGVALVAGIWCGRRHKTGELS
jgi:hypothetical protein